ncbi:DsbC family protein [Psychrobacter sanguinis]|uniref:Thiol:disulfide interchange protein n=1 Tax=Psychrobacter sanguinis TaxID=861445 RepID=A0A844M2A9_9GAMM|nr:DsbC family protein [Psychrobacter sanguinis]MUG32934.1 thioredoxin fold domain-containing protein [Psychrobacter sanguinis]
MTPLFRQNLLKKSPALTKASLMALAIAVAGCNSNSTEARNEPSKTPTSAKQNTSASSDSDPKVVAALEANFKASGFEQKIISAIPTSMDNIYWVTAEGMPAFFSDKEGRHIIQGQIVEIGQAHPIDISADLIAQSAKQKLAAVDKKEMIIYPAKGATKAVVYVFTDADCPYCTKLHSEMSDINAQGIEVRYLAWPRSDASIPKMEAIWCSSDRMQAMDDAKAGKPLSSPKCDSPVRSHIELGMSLGVSGTPAIFTESGHQIGGYLPAKELAAAALAH